MGLRDPGNDPNEIFSFFPIEFDSWPSEKSCIQPGQEHLFCLGQNDPSVASQGQNNLKNSLTIYWVRKKQNSVRKKWKNIRHWIFNNWFKKNQRVLTVYDEAGFQYFRIIRFVHLYEGDYDFASCRRKITTVNRGERNSKASQASKRERERGRK